MDFLGSEEPKGVPLATNTWDVVASPSPKEKRGAGSFFPTISAGGSGLRGSEFPQLT
jgi:hypothetical protein